MTILEQDPVASLHGLPCRQLSDRALALPQTDHVEGLPGHEALLLSKSLEAQCRVRIARDQQDRRRLVSHVWHHLLQSPGVGLRELPA